MDRAWSADAPGTGRGRDGNEPVWWWRAGADRPRGPL